MDIGTVWLLLATALVLFMTPGLAFFYGGLVKATSVVSMMMLSFGAMGLVLVLWILYGHAMGSRGDDLVNGVLADPLSDLGLRTLAADDPAGLAAVAFGATFAVITTALISGAVADRARFFPWLVFAGLWATLVYFPSQGWVWGVDADKEPSGWIGTFGVGEARVIDWAGGTVVHISAGAAALALALVLGRRRAGFAKHDSAPHNVPLVLIGAAILWFGWFGFNAGAATEDGVAALVVVNTIAAPAAGVLGFLVVEHVKDGKATAVGAASGVVGGLVAVTPACADLTPAWSIVLGLLAGVACCYAIDLKYALGFDDSLDVVGLHLVAGVLGCVYLGFFATDTGLLTGGDADQLLTQLLPTLVVAVYSFAVAAAVAIGIERTLGFRVREEDEIAGIDLVLHGEGYRFD